MLNINDDIESADEAKQTSSEIIISFLFLYRNLNPIRPPGTIDSGHIVIMDSIVPRMTGIFGKGCRRFLGSFTSPLVLVNSPKCELMNMLILQDREGLNPG